MSETEVAQFKQHICNLESRNKTLEDEVLALREQNAILQQWRRERENVDKKLDGQRESVDKKLDEQRESIDKKLDELTRERESVDKKLDELTSKIEKKGMIMAVDKVHYVRNDCGEGEQQHTRELVKIEYLLSDPDIVGADRKLQPTAHIVLSRATLHWAAFGETRIVLEDTPGKQFLFVSQDNQRYTEEKRDFHEVLHEIRDMEKCPIMFMTAGGLVIRRDNNDGDNDRPTMVYSPDMEPLYVVDTTGQIGTASYPKVYNKLDNTLGQLCGTLPDNRLLYAHYGVTKLDVYELPKHGHVAYLKRSVTYYDESEGGFSSTNISVSWHKASHWLAVADTDAKCLDLYAASYDHRTHVDLGYEPLPTNAVACVGDVIVVANNNGESLHLYNWAGKAVGTASKQELGMVNQEEQEKKNEEQHDADEDEEKEQEKTEVKIFGIGRAGVDMIHVITGTSCDEVKAVHLITII